MKDQEEHDVFKEEPVTIWQILFGKAVFIGTLVIFLFWVPVMSMDSFIRYSFPVLAVMAFLSKLNFLTMRVTHFFLFGFVGHFIAMWILLIAQR